MAFLLDWSWHSAVKFLGEPQWEHWLTLTYGPSKRLGEMLSSFLLITNFQSKELI